MEAAQSLACFAPDHSGLWFPEFGGVIGHLSMVDTGGDMPPKSSRVSFTSRVPIPTHPQLLLRSLPLTSGIFSRRLALAEQNCFPGKFWEFSLSLEVGLHLKSHSDSLLTLPLLATLTPLLLKTLT